MNVWFVLEIVCLGLRNGTNTIPVPANLEQSLKYLSSYTYSCKEGYTTTDPLTTICQPDGSLSLTTPPSCNGEFYQINICLVYILCSVETLKLCSTEHSNI